MMHCHPDRCERNAFAKSKDLGCVLVLLVCATTQAGAQLQLGPTTPRFANIARLAQEGYGDSARAAIARILTAMPRNDPAYAEALYTSGTVARSGDSMRAVFSRLAVDYAQSPWADKSLLRLVQLDFGLGKTDLALSETTRIFSDFPDSPLIPMAALWGARAAFSQQKMQVGCDWLTKGVAKVGDDLELRNQLLFARQGCNLGPDVQYAPVTPESLRAGPPRTAQDMAKRKAVPPPSSTPKTQARAPAKPPATNMVSPWRVQVTAVRDKAVIQSIMKKIQAAGFKPYAVPGPGGLTRVQAGPFATRAAAVAGLPKVKAAAGGKPIVVPAP